MPHELKYVPSWITETYPKLNLSKERCTLLEKRMPAWNAVHELIKVDSRVTQTQLVEMILVELNREDRAPKLQIVRRLMSRWSSIDRMRRENITLTMAARAIKHSPFNKPTLTFATVAPAKKRAKKKGS